jgi:hypothetical protein
MIGTKYPCLLHFRLLDLGKVYIELHIETYFLYVDGKFEFNSLYIKLSYHRAS